MLSNNQTLILFIEVFWLQNYFASATSSFNVISSLIFRHFMKWSRNGSSANQVPLCFLCLQIWLIKFPFYSPWRVFIIKHDSDKNRLRVSTTAIRDSSEWYCSWHPSIPLNCDWPQTPRAYGTCKIQGDILLCHIIFDFAWWNLVEDQ
jgi:hypothetical protein